MSFRRPFSPSSAAECAICGSTAQHTSLVSSDLLGRKSSHHAVSHSLSRHDSELVALTTFQLASVCLENVVQSDAVDSHSCPLLQLPRLRQTEILLQHHAGMLERSHGHHTSQTVCNYSTMLHEVDAWSTSYTTSLSFWLSNTAATFDPAYQRLPYWSYNQQYTLAW